MTTIISEYVFPITKAPTTIEIRKTGDRTVITINDVVHNLWEPEEAYLHTDGVNLGLIIAKDKGEESWIKRQLKSLLKKGSDDKQEVRRF